jgi:hypothetical protein
MRLAVFRQRQPQCVLGAGFADRAGDPDHLGRHASSRRGGKVAQAREHVRHDKERRVRRELRAPVGGDDGERGVGGKRGGYEFMTVAPLAVNGEKGFTRRDAAAVDRDARDRLRQRAL